MSSYDQWLTTDHAADQAEAYAEQVIEAWGTYVDTMSEYVSIAIPYEAHEPDHPEHAIYVAWNALLTTVQDYENRIQAEQEWEAAAGEYSDEQVAAIMAEQQMVTDSQADGFTGFGWEYGGKA